MSGAHIIVIRDTPHGSAVLATPDTDAWRKADKRRCFTARDLPCAALDSDLPEDVTIDFAGEAATRKHFLACSCCCFLVEFGRLHKVA